jgi:hypothetical protein
MATGIYSVWGVAWASSALILNNFLIEFKKVYVFKKGKRFGERFWEKCVFHSYLNKLCIGRYGLF